MADTPSFYGLNAVRFFAATVDVDMTELYAPFQARIPAGGWLMDAGCGPLMPGAVAATAGFETGEHALPSTPTRLEAGNGVDRRRFTRADEKALRGLLDSLPGAV